MGASSRRRDRRRTRFRSSFAALGCALTAAVGCSNPPVASIRYRLVGLPSALGGVCPTAAPDGVPVLPASKVRLTFRTPGGPLRCDLILPLGGGGSPVIDVPDRSQPVDLYAEYFDDAGNLVGRGQDLGIDLVAGGEVVVPVAPAGRFACTYGREVRARAFHTATLLPTGDVLVVGGLGPPDGTPNATAFDPTDGLFVTASAELYHPDSRTFTPIVIPGLTPRAMHAAYLFDNGDGLIHVALIGGITATGDPTTTPVLVPGTQAALGADRGGGGRARRDHRLRPGGRCVQPERPAGRPRRRRRACSAPCRPAPSSSGRRPTPAGSTPLGRRWSRSISSARRRRPAARCAGRGSGRP